VILRLVANQLRSLARDGVVRGVVVGYVFATLAACAVNVAGFLSAGEPQVARMGDMILPKIAGVQVLLLAALTPWMVLRLRDEDLCPGLVPGVAPMTVAPWQAVLGTLAALAVCLVALLSVSLPALSMIRLFGAVTLPQVAWSQADALVLLLVLALLVLALRLNSGSRAASWAFSYAALGALAVGWYKALSSMDHASASMLLLLSFLFLALLLFVSVGRSLRYARIRR